MEKKPLFIDTDVIIDYLRGHAKATRFLNTAFKNNKCFLSSISVAELYSGVRDGNEEEILGQFIEEFHIVHLDEKSAKIGGLLRRQYGKSHGSGLADCLIAAMNLEEGASFVTLNKKHFPMISNIKVPYQKN
jgi:predicted nucleic acid-binding protein